MKTKTVRISILFVFLTFTAAAQIHKMREKLNNATIEMGKGFLTLRFSYAQTGNPAPNVVATFTDIGNFKTYPLGIVSFPIPKNDGTYTIHVECKNYITVDFPIEIEAKTIFFNRFSLSKKMPIYRLHVLQDWGKRPADIDAHFLKSGDCHISYHNMTVSNDGIARLDRDDRDGCGPETITIKKFDNNGNYRFYVHYYSSRNHPNADRLSNSRANVRVYGNNRLMKTFQIPVDTEGNFLQVFTITNGQINEVNNVEEKLNF